MKSTSANTSSPSQSSLVSLSRPPSNRRVPTPGPGALDRVQHPPHPVLEQVGDVPDGVAVGEQVPAPGPVAVVVEPAPKDQVGRRGEEDTVHHVSNLRVCGEKNK